MNAASPEIEAAAKPDRTRTAVPQLPRPLQRIALTGFMGAGKSTVGRMLAGQLGWRFLDIDSEIERKCGQTVSAIFGTRGEMAFRALESHALAHALGLAHTVLALGGGALEVLANRLLLEQTPHTIVVHLDAPFATLYDRCVLQGGAAGRPVLLDPLQAEGRFHQRSAFYRRLSQLRVDTEGFTPAETVATTLLGISQTWSERQAKTTDGLLRASHRE